MSSSPVFCDGNDSVWHGKGGNGARFLDYSGVDAKYFACALSITSWVKEYAWERAGAHCVCDGWIIMGFDLESEGCFTVFFKVKFATKDKILRGVFDGYLCGCWDTVEP